MKLIFSLLLFAPSFSFASNCTALKDQADQWWAKTFDPTTVPRDQIDTAIQLFQRIQYPSAAQVTKVQSELKANLSRNLMNWLSISNDDCPQFRAMVGKALITSAAKNAKYHQKIKIAIKSTLMAQKYPTILASSIDAMLIDHGVRERLWSADAKFKADLAALRADLKKQVIDYSKEYNPAFERLVAAKDTSEKAIAKSADLERLKSGVSVDLELGNKDAARVKALAGRLR